MELKERMQDNTIRPTSADGNGVWLGSNSGSPQPQQVIFTNANKTICKKTKNKRLKRLLITAAIFIFILFLALCITIYFVAEMGEKSNICFTPDCIKAAASLLQSIDTEANPCENFYSFACGKWRQNHPSPEPVFINNWFQESFKFKTRDAIDFLKKENSDDEPRSVHEARLVFKTCLDFDSMEESGIQALWDLLDSIGLPRNPLSTSEIIQPWMRSLAKARRYLALDLLVGTGVIASLKNSSINKLVVGMPEEDQVLPGNRWRWEDKILREKYKKRIKDEGEQIVKSWKKYATKIIEYVIKASDNTTTISSDVLTDAAFTLLDIQRELLLLEEDNSVQEASLAPFPDRYSLKDLQFRMDNVTQSGNSKVQWKEFFEAVYEDVSDDRLEFQQSEPILVYNLPYLELLSQLVDDMDDKAIDLLIWWNVIYSVAPHVNEDLKELKEAFVRKILDVSPTNRKEVCMETVAALMKSAVGYQVKEFADPQTLTEIKDMLQNIRSSFANFIYALDWMDETTKYATVEKLYKMDMYVGYPNWFNDFDIMDNLYTNISLTNTTHLRNILNLLNEEMYEAFAALDYINNSSRDFFDPLDVNAYYDPSGNSITVPYGILQQPYYQMGLQALNYGGIGTILGHEMTHGLDNTGRLYDKFGNYREWWSNYSSQEYMKRETCYEEVYSQFYLESIDSNVNGATTLSENIADDGGIRDALAAYRSHVKKHGREAKLPGFLNYTHDQLFFLGFAHMWCSEYSDEALQRTLDDDEHSPNFVRVLVVLQNFHDFSESWNCPKGSYMNPDSKCKLWL